MHEYDKADFLNKISDLQGRYNNLSGHGKNLLNALAHLMSTENYNPSFKHLQISATAGELIFTLLGCSFICKIETEFINERIAGGYLSTYLIEQKVEPSYLQIHTATFDSIGNVNQQENIKDFGDVYLKKILINFIDSMTTRKIKLSLGSQVNKIYTDL